MEYSPSNAIPVHLARRRRHDRGGAGARRRGRLVGRSGAALRGGLVATRPRRRIAPPPSALPDQGPGVRADPRARCAADAALTEFDVQQRDGRLVRGRGARQPRSAHRRRRRKTPATRTTSRPRRAQPRRSAATSSCCSTSGASCRPRARCLLTSPGWGSQAERSRPISRRRSTRRATGRDAAIALVETRVADGRELRGFEVDRACRTVLEQAGFGAQFIHRTGHSLGKRGPWQRRPHGRLRDARRPPADSRHRLHHRAGRLYEPSSASGPRSTCSSASARRPSPARGRAQSFR